MEARPVAGDALDSGAPSLLSWKRPFDLTVGLVATVGFVPVIAVIWLLIKLDSPGPAFFRQERVGLDGRRFRIWKFRSMRHDITDGTHRAQAAAWFEARAVDGRYKSTRDPRVTRVGRIIRKTSLDELPQLFNVLSGEMSLVGPRPAIPYELEHYEGWYFERQRVKPGMTGLWQVSGRDAMSAKEMMRLDVDYVHASSLALDVKILLRTVPALLGRRTVAA